MTIQLLRTFEDPFYSMTSALDGADYLFEFRYSQREDAWYFSVSLTDGTALVSGVKVVCNRDLLSRFADSRLPAGMLVAASNGEDESPPGLEELGEGKRVELIYYTADELG